MRGYTYNTVQYTQQQWLKASDVMQWVTCAQCINVWIVHMAVTLSTLVYNQHKRCRCCCHVVAHVWQCNLTLEIGHLHRYENIVHPGEHQFMCQVLQVTLLSWLLSWLICGSPTSVEFLLQEWLIHESVYMRILYRKTAHSLSKVV